MGKAALGSSVGLIFVVSIVIGYYAGSWLDHKLGTSYWMPILTLIGIAAGFVQMVRIAIQLSKDT